MNWNPLVVAGVGVGVYAVGTVLKWTFGGKKKPRTKPVSSPLPKKEPTQLVPRHESTPAIREESFAIPKPTKQQEEPKKPAEKTRTAVKSHPPETSERKKRWYLIKDSTGAVRVCEAWDKTPKTIAGPFPSKAAALKAKDA